MDIADILQFKPEVNAKRSADDDTIAISAKLQKKSANNANVLTDEEKLHLLETAADNDDSDALDETSLKKLITLFIKDTLKNQEMRIKFAECPEKFMESELALHNSLEEMHVVATVPSMYNIVVSLNCIKYFLLLLSHENADIIIAVIDLLQELTDVDTLNDSKEGATALIDALTQTQIMGVLVQNLHKMDETESDEAQCVHNIIAIFENILEFRPDLSADAANQGLLQFLIKRIRVRAHDANKLYCIELLAIILQNSDEVRELLGEIDGIDTLLQQLAFFKRHDPQNSEEIEIMENTFNCLCNALMLPLNRDKFLKGEGLQLMNLLLREKKLSRFSALKVLDHAMSGSEGVDNCLKFVDILGLRTLFPLFIKSPKQNKKTGHTQNEHEEHIISIIAHLFRNTTGQQRNRLLSKFSERDYEKLDRLIELHCKYMEQVKLYDDEIERERKELIDAGEEVTEEDEEDFFLQKLSNGLYILQQLDYIILDLANSSSDKKVKENILNLLNLRGVTKEDVRYVVREYAAQLGSAKSEEEQESERRRLTQLIDVF